MARSALPSTRRQGAPAATPWDVGAIVAAGAALAAAGGYGFAGALPTSDLLAPVGLGALVGAGAAVASGMGSTRQRAVASVIASLTVLAATFPALRTGPEVLLDALGNRGWMAIRDAHAPAPATSAALATPYLATAVAAFLGTARLLRAGWGLLAAAPSLAVLTLGLMLGSAWATAPLAVPLAWATIALLVSGLLTRRPGKAHSTQVIAAGMVTAMVAAAAVPLADLVPAAEERWVLPPATETQVAGDSQHPLTTVVALRNGPDDLLFEATTSAAVPRWRLTALDRYDGQTWSSSQDFRSASTELPRAEEPDRPQGRPVTQTVERNLLGTDRADPAWGPWLPVADGVVSTSVEGLMFDLGTGTLLAPGAAGPDARSGHASADDGQVPERYRATSLIGAETPPATGARAATDAAGIAASVLPTQASAAELVDEIEAMAEQITTGATSDHDRAVLIQRHLLADGELALGDEAPSGHTVRHIRDFLASNQMQGTAEQYVTAFALLARAVGLPTRVVVGFEGSAAPGQHQVSAHDATAWVEVRFQDLGWVAFDAVPTTTAEVLPPAATTTTMPSRSEPEQPDQTPQEADGAETPTGTSTADGLEQDGVSARLILMWTGIGLLALLSVAPVARRAWRRRTWRRQPSPDQRVAGAWLWFLDDMRLAGLRADRTMGGTAIAARACKRLPAATQQIMVLNGLANRTAFGRRGASDAEAQRAWELVRTIARTRRQGRSLRQRLRELWTW